MSHTKECPDSAMRSAIPGENLLVVQERWLAATPHNGWLLQAEATVRGTLTVAASCAPGIDD